MTRPASPASAAAAAAERSRCAETSVLNRLAVMNRSLIAARIASDLDQVAVGVTAVMRRHRALRAGFRDRARGDLHGAGPQVRADFIRAEVGEEAQGGGARR